MAKIAWSHAVHSQACRNLFERTSGSCDSQPQIVIVAPRRVQPPDFFEDAPPHEGGRLIDDMEAVAECVFEIPAIGHEVAVDLPCLVDDAGGSEYDIRVRFPVEGLHGRAGGSRYPDIIGIQPGEDLALADPPTPIDGVERPTIRHGQPADPVAISRQDPKRIVCGPTI